MEYKTCEEYILNRYLKQQDVIISSIETLAPICHDLKDVVEVLLPDAKTSQEQKTEVVKNIVANLQPVLTKLLNDLKLIKE